MTAEPPDAVVDELYGAPPDEFIPRRDARAKELRKSDRAAADAVKKLRKPSVAAAAVNRLAREASDDVEALLGAGEALRQAQFGGGDRDAIRDASHDEREAVERLVGKAGKLSPSVLEEVRETLRAAATDEEARELIRRGILTESRRPTGLGGFGVAAAAEAPAAPPKRKAKPSKAKAARGEPKDGPDTKAEDDAERRRAEREAEAQRKREAKERVKAARAALREAEKAATAAERERDRAAKRLDEAERAAAKAREEAERRRGELEAAEQE